MLCASNLLYGTARLMKNIYAWLTHHSFLHIPLNRWFYAALITVLGFIVVMWICRGIAHRLRKLNAKSSRPLLTIFAEALENTRSWLILLLFASLGARVMTLPAAAMKWLGIVAVAALALQVGLWLNGGIRAWIDNKLNAEDVHTRNPVILAMLGWMMRIAIWATLLLVILSFAGVNITAFVASLGVGGVAIALALQNVLGDLFASMSIGLDKPFEVGHFINFGNIYGTVRHVGVKTTRLAALSGEEVIVGNADLLKNTVHNYGRMSTRRIVFGFGVTYDTDRQLLRQIPDMVHEIIDSLDDMRFDRAHFKSFGDSSLDFEVVYTMTNPDYGLFMDRQQVINLTLMDRFDEAGIEIAFPTRTLHMADSIKTEVTDRREARNEDNADADAAGKTPATSD